MDVVQWPSDIYISPTAALNRFQRLVEKHGVPAIEKRNPKLKAEKELEIAAKLLMGLQQLNHTRYFMRPGEDISPGIDIRAISWGGPDAFRFELFDLQVTEYEQHSNDILNVIDNKIGKASADNESRDLVVSVRGHGGELIDTLAIYRAMVERQPTFKSVWLEIQDFESDWVYWLVNVWPQHYRYRCDVLEAFKQSQSPPHWVRLQRGSRDELVPWSGEEYDLALP